MEYKTLFHLNPHKYPDKCLPPRGLIRADADVGEIAGKGKEFLPGAVAHMDRTLDFNDSSVCAVVGNFKNKVAAGKGQHIRAAPFSTLILSVIVTSAGFLLLAACFSFSSRMLRNCSSTF